MKYKKIVIFLIVCIIVSGSALITFEILSSETEDTSNNVISKEETSDAENIHQNIIQKDQNNENEIKEESISQVDDIESNQTQQINEVESQNTVSNIVKNEKIGSEEDSKVNQQSKKNKDQIATDLAKGEWGEDESVYYTIDRNSSDKYYICVRSKATTETLAEYEVDINKKTVEIK